jgi:hypothetical protein
MEVSPLTLQENEFMAENSLIQIIPNFKGEKVYFIIVND